MGELRDYVRWHDDYEQPGSHLHARLQVVIRMIRRALDELPAGEIRVLSLCAGQGADILGAADGHPRAGDLTGRLVELESHNVEQARNRIRELGLSLEAVAGDASRSDAYVGAIPGDLVLACGIFGNISDADIETTIRFLPSLCAPGAWVIWTRHPRDADLFQRLQAWLVESDLEAVELEVSDEQAWGVGANRLVGEPPPFAPGQQLFTFTR
ncbi:MAG: SAM-dependent methyltransferase [Acidimicrobiales bacterium]